MNHTIGGRNNDRTCVAAETGQSYAVTPGDHILVLKEREGRTRIRAVYVRGSANPSFGKPPPPTPHPTARPTVPPTPHPSLHPTINPTWHPTQLPTQLPTTMRPSEHLSLLSTAHPAGHLMVPCTRYMNCNVSQYCNVQRQCSPCESNSPCDSVADNLPQQITTGVVQTLQVAQPRPLTLPPIVIAKNESSTKNSDRNIEDHTLTLYNSLAGAVVLLLVIELIIQ